MKIDNRFINSRFSLRRLSAAIISRFTEIPHSIAWALLPEAHENKKKICGYKNKYNGERCFIVANGPSLRKTDLTMLNNEISFGLNRIYLNFHQSTFRPTFYVSVNELVLEQFATEITQLDMPKFINWNRRSFFPSGDRSITYLKSNFVIRDDFQNDLTRPMVFGGTVTFTALQLAFYMGFTKVVLVGLDHYYIEKGIPNEVATRNEEIDQSHFHKDYFPKGSQWQLPDLSRSELDYRIARKYFESHGREILDATIDGHCHVFNKVSYASLFEQNIKGEISR